MGETTKTRPNLSVLALISFIAAFTIARIFTSLYPERILRVSGIHIHHYWFGIAMLAIGGWLGISIENERINRVAAILFGAGGGLIGDEVGLLLTLRTESYTAGATYTIVIIFLALASLMILFVRYSKIIRREFSEFLRSNASLYFGVFLAAVSIPFSIPFILDTHDVMIITVSSVTTIIALIIILAYIIQRMIERE